MTPQSPDTVIRACVLAAGTSSRFGTTKLIHDFRGKPLLQHAMIAAQDACPGRVTLVVGHDAANIRAAAANLADDVVVNGHYLNGIGCSIAAGVRASRDSADAILIILADQPLLSAAHLRAMIESWSGADDEIVASTFGAVDCPPILFPSKTFDQLIELTGDRGARTLLSDATYAVRRIESAALRFDVDTQAQLDGLDQV